MGRIILGTGTYAKNPYFMEKFDINLYSVEELCYLLVERAELLDQEMLGRELVRWLDEQCSLNQLAHTLDALLNQNGSAAAFAGTILEYVGLYPQEIIARTEQTIRSNEGLNPYERAKVKADHLLQGGRYHRALARYHSLLAQLPEGDMLLRGGILHNMGTACARLFLFRQAADWFMQAYESDRNQESLESYLASLRMCREEKEYITYIAAHPEYHDASLRVERKMEQAFGQFEGTDENRMLFTLQVLKEEGSGTAGSDVQYYEEIERLTAALKEQYREYVL